MIGKAGYMGTLNGRTRFGSFFRSLSRAIIDMIYKVSAPNTDMVMISAVFPVNNAMIPMNILIKRAFAGVLNLG